MVDLSALRIQDLAAFKAFAEIAEASGTEIFLHGGAAFRAALFVELRKRVDFDIFDIVEFNSDIDIEHSGTAEQSAQIRAGIDQLIPFASWCRWSINDSERAARARSQREISTDVPLRRIRLSTARDAEIPDRARADLDERRVTFIRNPAFGADGEGRADLELFGLMMALNSWSEAQEIGGERFHFDHSRARAWLDELSTIGMSEGRVGPAIAARFWHLLSLRLARSGMDSYNERMIEIGAPMLDGLGISRERLADPLRAFSVSKITASANFRVPELTPAIFTGTNASQAFSALILDAARSFGLPREELPEDLLSLIDPSLELIGVVPDLTLLPYGSGKDPDEIDDDPFLSGSEQEFVQFAWELPEGSDIDPLALTGQILALGSADLGAATALPVVGGTFGRRRVWVRARLDDLIERGSDGGEVRAALLILHARADQAAEAESNPRARAYDAPAETSVRGMDDMRRVDATHALRVREVETEAEARPSYETEGG